MEWKKHKVLALLLAALLFLSAGLSSWSSRAEDLSEATEAEITDGTPMEEVQPTSEVSVVDVPAVAPAEEEVSSEEEEEEIAPPILDPILPEETEIPAEGATEAASETEEVTEVVDETEEAASTTEENATKEEVTEKKEAGDDAAQVVENILNTLEPVTGVSVSGFDFSSKELLIGTDDPSIFTADTDVVSEYNGVYLTRYETVEKTKVAYAYYYKKSTFVSANITFTVADDVDADLPDLNEGNDALANMNDMNAVSTPEKTIALIDTGVNATGLVASVSVLGGPAGDDNGHGTRMYNFIREEYPGARILSIKALGSDGHGKADAIVAAIQYAIESKVDVINLSLSASSTKENAAISYAVKEAVQKGIVVVGSAGNNGIDARFTIPGGIDEATIIGACDTNGLKDPKSNFGDTVDYYVAAGSTSEAAARYAGLYMAGKLDSDKIFDNVRTDTNIISELTSDGFDVAETKPKAATKVEKTVTINGKSYTFYIPSYIMLPLVFEEGCTDGAADRDSGWLGAAAAKDPTGNNPWRHIGDRDIPETEGNPNKHFQGYAGHAQPNGDTPYSDYDCGSYLKGNFGTSGATDNLKKAFQYVVMDSDGGAMTKAYASTDTAGVYQDGGSTGWQTFYNDGYRVETASATYSPSVNCMEPSKHSPSATVGDQFVLYPVKDADKTRTYANYFVSSGGNWIYVPYRTRIVYSGAITTQGNVQSFLIGAYVKVPMVPITKDYYIGLKKVDDAGNTLNDVSFDITVNGTKKEKAVRTGWKYDFSAGTYTNRRTLNPGVALVYLGKYKSKPTVSVRENWIEKYQASSPDPKDYTMVNSNPYTYKSSEIYETEADAISHAGDTATTWINNENGSLALTKIFSDDAKACVTSSRPNGSSFINPNYSLEGAVYKVYKTRANAANNKLAIAAFTTNSTGKGVVSSVTGDLGGSGTQKLTGLEQGTYYVKETVASKNCELDQTIHTVTIERSSNGTVGTTLNVEEDIELDPIQIEIRKQNAAGTVVAGNGGKSLAGAQFTMKFWPYDETESYTAAQFKKWAAQGRKPQKTWVFETKYISGGYYVAYDDSYKVSGDDLFYDESGYPALPHGWLTVEETKAPDGFTLEGGQFFSEDSNNKITKLSGNVLVCKTTEEMNLIVNNSLKLTDGMTLNNANVPERSDIELQKEDENGDPMEGVMFRITNTGTREAHIIATDANGYASTAASYQKHSENTGYYDDGKAYDGTKAGVWFAKNTSGADTPVSDDYGALCPGNYTIEELESDANKAMQYEPAKSFKITGKETAAVKFDFVNVPGPEFETELLSDLTGSHVIAVEAGQTLTDTVSYKNLKAATTYTLRGQLMLIDEDGNAAPYGAAVTKTFTTAAKTAEETSPFVKSGKETIVYTGVNGEDVLGKKLVSYQRLYLGRTADDTDPEQYAGYPEGSYMATLFPMVEEDPKNDLQTVSTVTGHTEATAPDQTDTVTSLGTITLTDKVYYNGLIVGKEYTVTGTLYVRPEDATGEEKYTDEELATMRLLDAEGNPITASKTFTATESEGSVDVDFTFDASLLKKKATTIVCFEEMKVLPEDVTVFTHADIFDTPQTVYVPAISTTAKSVDEREEKLVAFDDGNFIDTVSFENLKPNTTYTLSGTAMDKATGKALILNKKAVEAEITFTTGEANRPNGRVDGSVDVEFTIAEDQYDELKGKDIVIFEALFNAEGTELAHHTELDDRGQELFVPEIHTELTDDVTKTHIAYPDEKVSFTDVVSYKNLIPGKQYSMDAVLYDVDTGKPLLDENGKKITGSTKFTASESGEGIVEVKFTFNAKLLMVEGKTFVCFEECSTLPGLRRIAAHADLTDELQQMNFPKVGTKASITGKTVDENNKLKEIEITDILSYEKLQPGLTYIIRASLMKPDGTPAMVDGKAITAEKEFNPATADGSESITFASFEPEWNLDYDISEVRTDAEGNKYNYNMKGWSFKYVVFEEVYVVKDGEEHLIGEHKNLNDVSQTVTDTKKEEGGKPTPTTGDETPILWFGMMLLLSACGIAFILWRKRRLQ